MPILNLLLNEQNGRDSVNIFKCILSKKLFVLRFEYMFSMDPIDNKKSLVHVIPWHWTGIAGTKASSRLIINVQQTFPDSKVHGANTGPTWVLSAPAGPHVGPKDFAIRVAPCDQYLFQTASMGCDQYFYRPGKGFCCLCYWGFVVLWTDSLSVIDNQRELCNFIWPWMYQLTSHIFFTWK